ncbi:hypothetical protein F5ESL0263_03580 [Lactobacillus sp. ESL0263]|uniref:hypothetical protein n=1 Tax=Lactobacillus sp. ESL0263 TaxID=2069350 RepID=UPI000EFC5111|nr:hypothetical protein [Lactobacillus sp. ESL0263]RMC50108.1 hypothetical protein F5ESL0263_03580 [Lactobacillus sp. ESL0263]
MNRVKELREEQGISKEEIDMKKEIKCHACDRSLTDKVVVYRNHGYEDYYCTIDCLKSRVFQESVNQ